MTVTCPACGHESESPAPLETAVFLCNQCNARLAYGAIAPRVVVEPTRHDSGYAMLRIAFQDQVTKTTTFETTLDAQHAFLLAKSIISVMQ